MPNIRSAFVLALNMGRNPSTLSVPVYDSAELYHGDVVGGSQPYHASIDTADGDIDNMRWHCQPMRVLLHGSRQHSLLRERVWLRSRHLRDGR